MGKALKHRLKFWKQKAREPEDVSHHFRGRRCVSECEIYIYNTPLLRAIALEWLMRNPGVRTISEMLDDLNVRTMEPLLKVLDTLNKEGEVSLSTRYQMLAVGWHSHVEITPNEWLKRVAFEQENERRAL